MGLSKEIADSSIRLSFSKFTTLAEIKKTVEILQDLTPKLRAAK